MNEPKLKPGSNVTAALKALAALGECSTRDFLRITKAVSKHEDFGYALGDHLKSRGYIERRVVLTDKARRALEALQ